MRETRSAKPFFSCFSKEKKPLYTGSCEACRVSFFTFSVSVCTSYNICWVVWKATWSYEGGEGRHLWRGVVQMIDEGKASCWLRWWKKWEKPIRALVSEISRNFWLPRIKTLKQQLTTKVPVSDTARNLWDWSRLWSNQEKAQRRLMLGDGDRMSILVVRSAYML